MSRRHLPALFESFPSIFGESEFFPELSFSESNGLSVSEDENHIFVEASMPGLTTSEIEVTFQKGTLWISGSHEESEEDRKKKYYRRSSRNYSYNLRVPGNIDETKEPTATYKDGIMKVSFSKMPQETPKKIHVRS